MHSGWLDKATHFLYANTMQKNGEKVASHTTLKGTKRPVYDWNKIKEEYLAGNESLRELAKRYGMSQATIMKKSKKDGWIAEKERLNSIAHAKTVEKVSDQKSDINVKAMQIIQIIMDKALEGAQTIEGDSKSLKDYVSILKDLKDIGAIAIESKSSEITVSFDGNALDEYTS